MKPDGAFHTSVTDLLVLCSVQPDFYVRISIIVGQDLTEIVLPRLQLDPNFDSSTHHVCYDLTISILHRLSSRHFHFQMHRKKVSPLFLDLIISRQRAVKQPAFLDLRDVSDKGLVASLKNLMENDPVSFPILNIFSGKYLILV